MPKLIRMQHSSDFKDAFGRFFNLALKAARMFIVDDNLVWMIGPGLLQRFILFDGIFRCFSTEYIPAVVVDDVSVFVVFGSCTKRFQSNGEMETWTHACRRIPPSAAVTK